jgi:hypothetical protein
VEFLVRVLLERQEVTALFLLLLLMVVDMAVVRVLLLVEVVDQVVGQE